MMVVNVIIRRLAGVLAAAGLLATGAALELPPDVEEAFRKASIGEDGYLYSSNGGRELVVGHVKAHWKELLDHPDEIPSKNGKVRSALRVVGGAAEELPPIEYLDFLDHYLTVYSRGEMEDQVLRWQLGGMDRKNYFVVVNAEHPRVQALLKRAKELVPKENAEFQADLDEMLSGKRSDMYLSNKSDDAPLPETLPGIKLRKPFESILSKVTRLGKANEGAAGRSGRGTAGQSEAVGTEVGEGSGGGRLWGIATALALLVFALWRVFFKRRLAGTSR